MSNHRKYQCSIYLQPNSMFKIWVFISKRFTPINMLPMKKEFAININNSIKHHYNRIHVHIMNIIDMKIYRSLIGKHIIWLTILMFCWNIITFKRKKYLKHKNKRITHTILLYPTPHLVYDSPMKIMFFWKLRFSNEHMFYKHIFIICKWKLFFMFQWTIIFVRIQLFMFCENCYNRECIQVFKEHIF